MQSENISRFHLNFLDIRIITIARIAKIGIIIYHNSGVQIDLVEGSGVVF